MVSLWPRSSVTQWSLLLALLSLSSLNSLSLSSLSLSLFWGDSNSHKQNQTTVPTNSLSLLLVLSLSLSLSLSVLYFSFFLSEVILKATEQRLPVHKHWVPAQALLLSLCVTKDCQESSVTVCYKSQNKSQSQRIPHHQNRLNDSQRSQHSSPMQQELPKLLKLLSKVRITKHHSALPIVWFYAPRTGDFYRDLEIFKVICKVTPD